MSLVVTCAGIVQGTAPVVDSRDAHNACSSVVMKDAAVEVRLHAKSRECSLHTAHGERE